jgi:sugar fermentation stimulation protein A
MRWPQLVRGELIRRENRFRAAVRVAGAETSAHVANSGRLRELLVPGSAVWLVPVESETRKTAPRKTGYDLALVESQGALVSVDARLPNRLFAEALAGRWPDCEGRPVTVMPEARRGESRLDFVLSSGERRCWVEVKSVTLVREGLALFPDAPTLRGARHLRELADAIADRDVGAEGDRAAVVFIVQRGDATRFAPNAETDPAFARALTEAARAGVAVRAFGCRVDLGGIVLANELPVQLA